MVVGVGGVGPVLPSAPYRRRLKWRATRDVFPPRIAEVLEMLHALDATGDETPHPPVGQYVGAAFLVFNIRHASATSYHRRSPGRFGEDGPPESSARRPLAGRNPARALYPM